MKTVSQSVKPPCHLIREDCWTLLRDSFGSEVQASMNIEWLMDQIENTRGAVVQ